MIKINLKPCCDTCLNADIECDTNKLARDGNTSYLLANIKCSHSEVCEKFNKVVEGESD